MMINIMSKKIFFIVLSGSLLTIIIGAIVLISHWKSTENSQVVCTMEAKICPDGSAVGRGGSKCEFAPCP
jgi:hypothetical protein